jgi:hypothetical protein
MKEDTQWKGFIAVLLVTLTLSLMTVHLIVFQDSRYLFTYLLADLAFIPLEVICVTLIIDRMLSSREREQRMEKLNMVIGIFFSWIGTPLLARFAKADLRTRELRASVAIGPDWTAEKFRAVVPVLAAWDCKLDPAEIDLVALRDFLVKQEDFILRIVENPMVFEHESFTEVILAVTHLSEELIAREDLTNLPPTDIIHLKGDMERVYSRLVPEWLKYMEYMHRTYPYLFSLGMRKNPFDEHARVVVER